MELIHRWVRFRIRDITVPNPQTVLIERYGDEALVGQVMDLSDSGRDDEVFAVVQVREIDQPVIVPVARIVPVDE